MPRSYLSTAWIGLGDFSQKFQAVPSLQWNTLCMTDKDNTVTLIFLPSSSWRAQKKSLTERFHCNRRAAVLWSLLTGFIKKIYTDITKGSCVNGSIWNNTWNHQLIQYSYLKTFLYGSSWAFDYVAWSLLPGVCIEKNFLSLFYLPLFSPEINVTQFSLYDCKA